MCDVRRTRQRRITRIAPPPPAPPLVPFRARRHNRSSNSDAQLYFHARKYPTTISWTKTLPALFTTFRTLSVLSRVHRSTRAKVRARPLTVTQTSGGGMSTMGQQSSLQQPHEVVTTSPQSVSHSTTDRIATTPKAGGDPPSNAEKPTTPQTTAQTAANSVTAPTRCPFARADQLIEPGAPVRCPFHAHNVPEKFQLKEEVPLNLYGRTHYTSEATAELLADIGGPDRIREMCTRFYAQFFEDPVLVQFIFETDGAEAHGQRLADWIIEKMDENQKPWTESGRHGMRQPSHYRAWNNRARHPAVRGDHFKLDDARIWMRLHFWAAREAGLGPQQHPVFWNWYKKFLGHFIRVYDRGAPPYVDESAAWSANPKNIIRYIENGRRMVDVIRARPGYVEG